MKTWRPFKGGECLHCGDDAEVLTDSGQDDFAYDGDEARCVGCGCPGSVRIEAEDEASCDNGIVWHDEPNCDCQWCKEHPAQ